MKHFEPVHLQKVSKAGEGIIAQMLVIDGVVLQALHQPDQIMRLGNEHAVRGEQIEDAFHDCVHILDMGKAVRGRDHARSAVLAPHVGGHGRSEVALQGRNAA